MKTRLQKCIRFCDNNNILFSAMWISWFKHEIVSSDNVLNFSLWRRGNISTFFVHARYNTITFLVSYDIWSAIYSLSEGQIVLFNPIFYTILRLICKIAEHETYTKRLLEIEEEKLCIKRERLQVEKRKVGLLEELVSLKKASVAATSLSPFAVSPVIKFQ